ncbi:MAG: hypothetical protein HUJ72_11995 [Blautia sp.]|nr:hypothetical protein [Blautia sp.]
MKNASICIMVFWLLLTTCTGLCMAETAESAAAAQVTGTEDGAQASSAVMPTPTPAVTPIPRFQQNAEEEEEITGTLSKPDHPDSQTVDKLIFVGDSRTVMMRDAVHDDSVWSCKSAMGYDWMTATGVPAIEDEIEENTAVIFWMGVNDPHNITNYINYVNVKAKEWELLGAQTYYLSVGPLHHDLYTSNTQIESFNQALEANLIGVYYLDVYSYLMENGFATTDGIHYTDDVSIEVYNFVLENLVETRYGIWG